MHKQKALNQDDTAAQLLLAKTLWPPGADSVCSMIACDNCCQTSICHDCCQPLVAICHSLHSGLPQHWLSSVIYQQLLHCLHLDPLQALSEIYAPDLPLTVFSALLLPAETALRLLAVAAIVPRAPPARIAL